jgi:hypothetical protein
MQRIKEYWKRVWTDAKTAERVALAALAGLLVLDVLSAQIVSALVTGAALAVLAYHVLETE